MAKQRSTMKAKTKNGEAKANPTMRTVLVATYRPENVEWIRNRRLYNLPLPKCGKVAFHDRISRVVLIAEEYPTVAYSAKLKDVVDRDWLKSEGYKVAPKNAAHGERYVLYELNEKLSAASVLSDASAEVFVSSSRCPNVRIDAAFYAKPYPRTGGRSMPYIFDRLKPYFKKWRSATTFNPMQLDFLAVLDDVEAKMLRFRNRKRDKKCLRFIDLFAGIGGIRKGFEFACQERGYKSECVFTSEIKPHALEVLRQNHPGEYIHGDITKVDETTIPDFDILLGGFPCQAFSAAGKRLGFEDTRGTLFFDVARIIKAKRPFGFVLENVEGLVNHEREAA